MSTVARGPRLVRGALVTTTATGARSTVIPFQYNPATLSRTLQPQYFGSDETARTQAVRFAFPAVQTITLDIELDAVDLLEAGDALTARAGLQPQLAALEMLVHPSLSDVSQRLALLATGTLEIAPILAPPTLFVWGPRRVLPVRVESFTVEEQLFDPSLNPIQAHVNLQLRVLTYADLDATNPSYALYMAYQTTLEGLAASSSNSSQTTGLASGVPNARAAGL
jgi:contractile injection system tube protein